MAAPIATSRTKPPIPTTSPMMSLVLLLLLLVVVTSSTTFALVTVICDALTGVNPVTLRAAAALLMAAASSAGLAKIASDFSVAEALRAAVILAMKFTESERRVALVIVTVQVGHWVLLAPISVA